MPIPMPTPVLIAYGVFFFALGGCVGSFLNVVIWRLPHRGREIFYQQKRGPLTLSWPPSHCPVCDAPIRWYQNIPIFSWIALRGRCATCGTTIPIRYPLVELGTAGAFLALYLAYFGAHWQPGFVDLGRDWPALVEHLILIAALFAGSAIDADYFIIPPEIPYLLFILALLANPWIDSPVIPRIDTTSTLANPTLAATLGVLFANLLLWTKTLPRSFAEDHRTESARAAADAPAAAAAQTSAPAVCDGPPPPVADAAPSAQDRVAPPPKLTRFGFSAAATIAIILATILCGLFCPAKAAALVGLCGAILIFLIGVLPRDAGQTDVTDEVMEEISGPQVRAEVAKEGLFLGIPLAFAIAAAFIPWHLPASAPLDRLLGTLLGALVGGGIVWFIRIAGTMAFNKEAMGMGDAHLLIGIGAIVGAPLIIITFLTAPFIGILWAVVLLILGKPNVLPYGPWLSVAAIINLLIGTSIIAFYVVAIMPS
ncbi:MAG TPA: prepilin peptidase [Phycisphaerae bacterium]|nr:prepilin peptidase [Phycisphaerae bacterium]